MIKRCQCLRYLCLKANRRDEGHYFFYEEELLPIEAIFTLEDFEPETGHLIPICPLYNYLHEGRLIVRAYDKFVDRTISEEDKLIIKDVVENCPHLIPINKYLVFTERQREIIENFCREKKIKKIWRLLKHFISFYKKRKEYKDDTLCKDVSPSEKKKCFDQLWITAFEEYLKDVKFNLPK